MATFESEAMQHELEEEFSGEAAFEEEYESALESEGWLGTIGNVVGSLLGEGEEEYESALEGELNPIRKVYPDAMMEHLGELAFEAETEEEAAEHFLPLIGMAAGKLLPVVAKAVAPMAKKVLPKIARAVTRATPNLTRGVGNIARTLHRNPQTRHLLKTVPTIARRTVGSIARQAAHGRPITPRTAVRTLATQTRRVLGHPGQRRHALRRHHHLERRFHRRHPGMIRPHWRWRYGRPVAFPAGAPGAVHPTVVVGGAPGTVVHPGSTTVVHPGGATVVGRPATGTPVRPGQIVAGHCTCAPCPAHGGAAPAPPLTPAYCRCCGQVLR